MNSEAEPIVGNWYRHLDKGQQFQVVAVDEEAAVVEIQHFDGDIEEIDLDEWSQLEIEPTDEPENWSGALDVAELDDLTGTEVTDTQPEEWSEPLEEQPRAPEPSVDEAMGQEEEDEWGEGRMEEEPLEAEPGAEGSREYEEGEFPEGVPGVRDEE